MREEGKIQMDLWDIKITEQIDPTFPKIIVGTF